MISASLRAPSGRQTDVAVRDLLQLVARAGLVGEIFFSSRALHAIHLLTPDIANRDVRPSA